MKHILISIFVILGLVSCGSNSKTQSVEDEINRKVDSIMATMNLQQKVAQLFIAQIDRNNTEAQKQEQDSLVEMGLGGIIIMRGPIAPFIDRMNELQASAQIPILTCTDAEWGAAMRFAEYMPYPRQYQLGKIDSGEDLLYRMGLNVGKELKDLNIYVNFAPVCDMMHYEHEYANNRMFGTNLERTSSYALQYMKGMQDAGILACAKHYPGHGDTEVDAHKEMPVFHYTRQTMDTIYLKPFQRLVDNGVGFVMIGHCAYPDVTGDTLPASISHFWVNDVLRKDMGFKGIVTTDALGMGGVMNGRTPLEVNLAAYKAGIDMLLMSRNPIESINAIADSVAAGVFSLEDLNNRVRKVLTFKARLGFFKEGYSPFVYNLDEKIEAARERDSLLIDEMKAIIAATKVEVKESTADATLQMDRGVDK